MFIQKLEFQILISAEFRIRYYKIKEIKWNQLIFPFPYKEIWINYATFTLDYNKTEEKWKIWTNLYKKINWNENRKLNIYGTYIINIYVRKCALIETRVIIDIEIGNEKTRAVELGEYNE